MKTNRILAISLIMAVCSFMFGCAINKGAEELVNYANQGILNIAELERKSLARYTSVIGENYTTDQGVYNALMDEVIPVYKRFLDGLREIHPMNEDIKKVHGIYIRAAESLYSGFKTKMVGIETKNERIIKQANEQIEKGRKENLRWRLELIELYKKYGVAEMKEEEKP
ncbi:MAG: hypothetical protein JRJ65_03125 [Deltaproteobacteria bacterium]|nr:hypothetical protein [Deltaproteobacteria bacterium]